MRVLDLGGTAAAWQAAPVQPGHVTVLNLHEEQPTDRGWMSCVIGDACSPPPTIRSGDFDLVYSNSVIEHLGGHARRRAFADLVRTLAPHHWVQTPNRYFPIEPHWLWPGFQFLPVRSRSFLCRKWSVGWYSLPAATHAEAVEADRKSVV